MYGRTNWWARDGLAVKMIRVTGRYVGGSQMLDEKAFTGEGLDEQEKFWLFQTEVQPDVLALRKELGESKGWVDERWHEDVYKLKELYDELSNNNSTLLDKLEESRDEYTRLETLKEVVQVVIPPQQAKEVEPHHEAPPAVAPAASETPAVTEATKKVSPFAKKQAAQAPPASDAVEPGAESGPTEAPRKSSVFAGKSASKPQPETAQDQDVPAPAEAPAKRSMFQRKAADQTAEAAKTDPEAKPAAETAPGGPVNLDSLEAELRDRHGDEFDQRLAAAQEEIEAQLAAAISTE